MAHPGIFIYARVGIVWLGLALSNYAGAVGADSGAGLFYDADPAHLWNRLNAVLFERTGPDGKKYGVGELDILYWLNTKHLIEGESRRQAITVLDEFIEKDGEKLVREPLKRALLQRDLWQLFDWSARRPPEWEHQPWSQRRGAGLQRRLATVIRKVALATNEIAALPDNYAAAEKDDFPRGLFWWQGMGASGSGADRSNGAIALAELWGEIGV